MKIKMSYLLKSSNSEDRRRSAQKKVWITVVVLAILMIILGTAFARQSFFSLASPILKLENVIANSHLAEYFTTKQSLIEEKSALERKLFALGDLSAINVVLQNENDLLKNLLGRKDGVLNTILATVLVKPPQTPYDTLLVDIGLDYQAKVGDKVIANANIYVGEVSEVYEHSAKVTLYSTPGWKLSVTLGENSISAEAIGIGGGNFNISLPKEVDIKEGDTITVPSIISNIFGIVEKVDSKEKDSAQTVLFKSPINISELKFVEVIID